MSGLKRLLRGEEQVSDLIAMLVDLDPEPLARVLGLDDAPVSVVREELVRAPGRKKSGRVDLLVKNSGGSVVALLELKVGAGQHGDQYAAYDAWAKERGLADRCWLVSLAGGALDAPTGWKTDLPLSQLVGAWRDSTHAHAAWLGGAAADVLGDWERQLDQRLGLADDPIVAALLVKRLKADLQQNPLLQRKGAELWRGMRTNGGAPMLLVWVPVPGHEELVDVATTLDLRAERTELQPRNWVLRLGVQVFSTEDRTRAAARALAHDTAVLVADRLTRTAFVESLPPGSARLAAALGTRGGGWWDGLAGEPTPEALATWRRIAVSGERPGAHPLLFHDGGLRLASQLPLDASNLDRHDMRRLLEHAHVHLSKLARDVKAGR